MRVVYKKNRVEVGSPREAFELVEALFAAQKKREFAVNPWVFAAIETSLLLLIR